MTTILEARRDPVLLGPAFRGDTWAAHDVLLAGAFGLPMTDAERERFIRLAQRPPPPCRVSEYWLLAGRRAGKDQIAALIACYLAGCERWPVTVGEVPTVLVLAADRDQARVAYNRVRGMLEASPLLSHEIAALTSDRITLANGAEIQIGTSDYRAVRGRSLCAVVADEICFWHSEGSASPDAEVIAAVRPALATMPGSMLVAISSVYARRGVAYEMFRRYHGIADPHVLVVRAPTTALNPTVSQRVIDQAFERDPQAAAAEWLSEWRSDLAAFVDGELLDAVTRSGPRELPPVAAIRDGAAPAYIAGLDVSGGRSDATALAIAHREGDRVVVDGAWRWPSPHDPGQIASSVRETLARYRLNSAIADQYGAEVVRAVYRERGVALVDAPASKSDTYIRLVPLLAQQRVELPDCPILRRELLGLERRTRSGGRDVVDHRPGGHDDVANAVALAVTACARQASGTDVDLVRVMPGIADPGSDPAAPWHSLRRGIELQDQGVWSPPRRAPWE